MANEVATEVANASMVLDNELESRITPRTGRADFLVQTAKQLQRLQTKRSKMRRDLKVIEQEIRMRKRELKALAQEIKTGH
jgi:hypothetical protein